ncbi:ThuA domain-containing protein [bacterium]|nr:ThuA domain-containing protein [bacterium]
MLFRAVLFMFLCGCAVAMARAADVPEANALSLRLHRRLKQATTGTYALRQQDVVWDGRKTAVVVCDMWDKHWCKGATSRVAEMAPRMNLFLEAARRKGALIIHAPSACMAAYKDHAARRRAQAAPKAANLPKDAGGWCRGLPSEKGQKWPIDQADGGCDCEPKCKGGNPWRRQIDTLTIRDEDAISDSGVEVWNVMEQRGITHVMLLGVHTNMCVIGRPFGLRNMARFGKNVVLVRDLTDTMYNSRSAPHVSHFTGTDLVVEHIETAVCPTVASDQVLGGKPFRFKADRRPRVVLVAGETHHYGSEGNLRLLTEALRRKHGMCATLLVVEGQHDLHGAELIDHADLLVLYVRRRVLRAEQMKPIRAYLDAGKPLVAFRTSSHAFALRKGKGPEGTDGWPRFDRDVLGCNYAGHGSGDSEVRVAPGAAKHPILTGIEGPYRLQETLYRSQPLLEGTTLLMMGRSLGSKISDEPVAWTYAYKGGRVFYTSMGHSTTFQDAWFLRLVVNAVHWAMGRDVPAK